MKSLVSGVAASPARIGFRSTYTRHVSSAASSSSALALNRPSQNRPRHPSSALARRAKCSSNSAMNQLRLHSRPRSTSTRSASRTIAACRSAQAGSSGTSPVGRARRSSNHRRATSSADHSRARAGIIRGTTCWWSDITAYPSTSTANTPLRNFSRCWTQTLRWS